MAAKTCVRCGADVYGRAEDQPHLCKDIAKRLARRERQVQAVLVVLGDDSFMSPRTVAEAIVNVLAGLGVQDD